MSYYANVYGEIDFDPPILGEELRALQAKLGTSEVLALHVDVEQRFVAEGVLTVQSASRILPDAEQPRAYSIVDSLEKIVAGLPGRTFTGELRIEGDESLDVRRVLVRDGEVVVWRAKVTWPDGVVEESHQH